MRIAVIGVGHHGRNHARILASLPGVELVAVVDINGPRAQEIAATNRTRAVADYRTLIGQVDAVTIATPTGLHADIGTTFLRAGTPALIEKPLARTLQEADALIDAARQGGAVLA